MARLKAGATEDDVRHVIAVSEAEAKVNETSAQYFNAVSPFRPEQFSRLVAREVSAAKHAQKQTSFNRPAEPPMPKPLRVEYPKV